MLKIKEEFVPDSSSFFPVLLNNSTGFCTYRLNLVYRILDPDKSLHDIFSDYSDHFHYFKRAIPQVWSIGKVCFSQYVTVIGGKSYFKIVADMRTKVNSSYDGRVSDALTRIENFINS